MTVILEVNEVAGIRRARGQVLTRVALSFERLVFRRADRIVVVSSFLNQEVVARGAKKSAVVTIPNAIDPRRFDCLGTGKPIRDAHALNGSTVLGFVGWFDAWDRLDMLIDVVSELSGSQPGLRLMLVGGGPLLGQLTEQIDRCGLQKQTILTGPVSRSQVPAYIDAMDICVLPDSNPYGSPMVLLEFMAMGKAVVAPDYMPICDVIRDGRNGCVVEHGKPDRLREAILALTEDMNLRRRLGDEARRDVLESHTWASTARMVAAFAGDSRKGQNN